MSERPPLGATMRPRLLFASGSALVAVVVAAAAFAFLWPSESRSFDLGPLDQFAPGTVTTYNLRGGLPVLSPDGRVHTNAAFHVVRLEDGEIRALSSKDPHLGCAVPWRPDFEWDGETGFFRNPCHGETFDMAGNRVFGPSPRGLDRFGVEIENGHVVVDLGEVTRGPRGSRVSPADATPADATPAATATPRPLEPTLTASAVGGLIGDMQAAIDAAMAADGERLGALLTTTEGPCVVDPAPELLPPPPCPTGAGAGTLVPALVVGGCPDRSSILNPVVKYRVEDFHTDMFGNHLIGVVAVEGQPLRYAALFVFEKVGWLGFDEAGRLIGAGGGGDCAAAELRSRLSGATWLAGPNWDE